jgi:Class III cytochrome C family
MTKKIKKIKFMFITIFSCLFIISFILPNINLSLTKAFSLVMPSILVLDDPDNGNSKFAGGRGKTPFDHDQHISTRANTTCVTCHHTNSNSLSIAIEEEVPKCTTCHIEDESTCQIKGTNETKNFVGETAISTKKAFHGDTSEIGCIGCHEKRNIEPKGCDDCHTKTDTVNYLIKPFFPEEKDKLKPAMPIKANSPTKVETPIKTTDSETKPVSTNNETKENGASKTAIEQTKSEVKETKPDVEKTKPEIQNKE